MKKKLLGLLAVVAVCIPMCAGAVTLKESFTTKDCKSSSKDGFTTFTCPLILKEYADNSEGNIVSIDFSNYGEAVTEVKCATDAKDGFEFNADASELGATGATCVFKNVDTVEKSEVTVGSLVYTIEDAKVDKDHSNCGLVYSLGEVQGKINPKTGAELPYVYIVGALVLAAGIITVSTKKTKLFNI